MRDIMSNGILYVVATPIGNMKDITLRAIEILQSADIIAAEDTRHSLVLLRHYGIKTKAISLHQHNENQRATEIISCLQDGRDVALISDAGTPVISDPGELLIKKVIASGVDVVPIPGACALITALSASGVVCDNFLFKGFLPAKGVKRLAVIEEISATKPAVVLYESVHRIESLLVALSKCLGEHRQVVVARELTKRYETFLRGTASEVLASFYDNSAACRGEFVVIIEQDDSKQASFSTQQHKDLLSICLQECSPKVASKLVATMTGESKNKLYKLALTLQDKN